MSICFLMGERKGFKSNLREGGATEGNTVRGNCNRIYYMRKQNYFK